MTKIMLVGDEHIVALHLKQMLQSLGYTVSAVVSSGSEALRRIGMDPPHLVLMDTQLDGDLDGIETASRIPRDLAIPVIYLSAYSEESTLSRARVTRPFAFLVKPFSERELHAAIIVALERHAVEAEIRQDRDRLERALRAADPPAPSVQADLLRLAHYDSLTGLPNRLLAMDRLRHAIQRRGRDRKQIALMLVDLDRFKSINDSLGHMAGDDLLQSMAKRMRGVVRQDDTVARLGGDEFMVILERIQHAGDVVQTAGKILTAIAQPIDLAGEQQIVTASIGISLFPGDSATLEELIQAADTAMYAAKRRGRHKFAFYAREMTADAVSYLTRARDLRRGFAERELELHYQPQISSRTRMLVGVEALLRWRHPEKGVLEADQFVPLAEKSGLIVDIGEWVLARACQQLVDWHAAGLPQFKVSVNVSAQQIRNGRLIASVQRALTSAACAARFLELEVTENLLRDEEEAVPTLRALSALGVGAAIDGFGTGFSCLSILRTLPVQRLKIDRRFVAGLFRDGSETAVVEVTIAMARRLGLSVVGVGVESSDEESFLKGCGCHELQGLLYAKPLVADDVRDFCKS